MIGGATPQRDRRQLAAAGHALRIIHPGPPAPDRIQAALTPLVKIEATLQPGQSFCDSIGQVLAAEGITAAALQFRDLTFQPMRYVQPAHSTDPGRVAWYSATRAPRGVVAMDRIAASYGQKDGAPFIHCHALWTDDAGQMQGGHILPHEARLARPARMIAHGTRDAALTARPDPETGFALFDLAPAPRRGEGRLVVARLRPNVDLVTGCQEVCAALGVNSARVLSGIGSTIGAQLEGQPEITAVPTELIVTEGRITRSAAGWEVDLPVGLIDIDGRVHRGRPERGANPVLICFELFLQVEAMTAAPDKDHDP